MDGGNVPACRRQRRRLNLNLRGLRNEVAAFPRLLSSGGRQKAFSPFADSVIISLISKGGGMSTVLTLMHWVKTTHSFLISTAVQFLCFCLCCRRFYTANSADIRQQRSKGKRSAQPCKLVYQKKHLRLACLILHPTHITSNVSPEMEMM